MWKHGAAVTFTGLKRDAQLLGDAVASLDGTVDADLDDLEAAYVVWDLLGKASKVLTDCKQRLGHKIGLALPPDEWTVLDGRSVRRRPYISRTKWDHDALIVRVRDSVRVDKKTGEIVPETEIEKRNHVWPAKGYQASITALRDRGIEPDEFCTERFDRWNLEVQ